MAVHTSGNYLTRVAGQDLSTSQYCIVVENASRQLVLANSPTQNFFGVLQDISAAGAGANVTAFIRNGSGTFKVIAGGNITIGDSLTVDANGHAITTTTTGNEVIGTAEETAVAGQVLEYRARDRKY